MKAFVHNGPKGLTGATYTDITVDQRELAPHEVKVKIKAAGLNRRELLVVNRRTENDPAVVMGSDGAGIVEATGADVTHVKAGDEVIINPSLHWHDKTPAPPEEFDILGHPTNGTFAEYIILPAQNVEPKPAYLTWEEAAVLGVAGITGYRALFTRGQLQAGQTVLIPGIGSGVATFVLQMAKAAGARVIVTSRSLAKRERALELGADLAIDTACNWSEALNGEKVDLVIESIGPATINQSLSVLKKGGTLVTFGATTGDDVTFNIRTFFYGHQNILGTTLGSAVEFRELIQFLADHNIRPVLDQVYPLSETMTAIDRLVQSEQFGKIALRVEE
ncbi:zinc-binding dehydrogenase [Brevibacillus dissolubilis]|uniref:zinc-binding dehydrogenase n=1 Tax=Brevibacillus dissolubilis TaxID=1844116 RepID=UPI0011179649|nr:zinc-binding dehydrogenase [Brevibacillus dissolubilis]